MSGETLMWRLIVAAVLTAGYMYFHRDEPDTEDHSNYDDDRN